MAYNRHRAPPESDREASEGDENLGEITGSQQLRGVLLKDLVALSLIMSISPMKAAS